MEKLGVIMKGVSVFPLTLEFDINLSQLSD